MPENLTPEQKTPEQGTNTKKSIVEAAYPEITKAIDAITSKTNIRAKEKIGHVKGAVFEHLAIQERIAQNPETETQRELRQIFETLMHNAGVALGVQKALSNPDGISVIFDKHNRPIVDEIHEMKASAIAYAINIDDNQPQKTLRTIQRLVNLVNSLAEEADIDNLQPSEKISNKLVKKRRRLLTETKQRIMALNLKEKFSLSPHLKYMIIIPKGEVITNLGRKISLKDGTPVEMVVVNSIFSIEDIHKLIDQYAETT